MTEGGDARFTLNLNPAPTANLRVDFTISEDTSGGQGFVASGLKGGTNVTVAANSATSSFTVPTTDDSTDEPNGSVTATLTARSGYMVGTPSSASVTVNDDDVPAPNLFWGIGLQQSGNPHRVLLNWSEDVGTFQVVLQPTRAVPQALSVTVTVTGTATHGTDYTFGSGVTYANGTATFTIPAGTPRFGKVFFPVSIVNDSVSDTGETIVLTIDDTSTVNRGSTYEMRITITEDSGDADFEVQGLPRVGETLTVVRTGDDPDGNGTIRNYQWFRVTDDDQSILINGTTGATLTLTQNLVGLRIGVTVHYTDGNGNIVDIRLPRVGPVEDLLPHVNFRGVAESLKGRLHYTSTDGTFEVNESAGSVWVELDLSETPETLTQLHIREKASGTTATRSQDYTRPPLGWVANFGRTRRRARFQVPIIADGIDDDRETLELEIYRVESVASQFNKVVGSHTYPDGRTVPTHSSEPVTGALGTYTPRSGTTRRAPPTIMSRYGCRRTTTKWPRAMRSRGPSTYRNRGAWTPPSP